MPSRDQVVSITRQFFTGNHFSEAVSPVFVDHPAPEANLTAFAIGPHYLATSPEHHLKKLISVQPQNYFSIAHSFRDLEANNHLHQPEFLMLEWYELHHTYQDIISTTQQYLSFIYSQFGLTLPPSEHINLNLEPNLSEPDFNQQFLNQVEPLIPKDRLVFVTGYPQHLSYFSAPMPNNPQVAARFEAYLGGVEICNGNTEDTASPFIIPSCAGCGLGLDRLTFVLNQQIAL